MFNQLIMVMVSLIDLSGVVVFDDLDFILTHNLQDAYQPV